MWCTGRSRYLAGLNFRCAHLGTGEKHQPAVLGTRKDEDEAQAAPPTVQLHAEIPIRLF